MCFIQRPRRKAVSVGASILNATAENEGTMFSTVNPLQMTYPGKAWRIWAASTVNLR